MSCFLTIFTPERQLCSISTECGDELCLLPVCNSLAPLSGEGGTRLQCERQDARQLFALNHRSISGVIHYCSIFSC